MTAKEFLNFDNDTPAAEELSENWEYELVQWHKNKATTEEDNEDSDQEPQEQESLLKLNTHNATLDLFIQSETFSMEKGLPVDCLNTSGKHKKSYTNM